MIGFLLALVIVQSAALVVGLIAWRRRPPRLEYVDAPYLERVTQVERVVEVPVLIKVEAATRGEWAEGRHQMIQAPLEVIEQFADPAKLNQVRRLEADYLAAIATSIAANGLREALLLTVDERGCACLHDGYHRLAVAAGLDFAYLPVRLETSEEIRGYRRPLDEFFRFMLAPKS